MEDGTIKKIVEEPSVALEKTIAGSKAVERVLVQKGRFVKRELEDQKPVKELKHSWRIIGPGLTAGASDDDPSSIVTYSQAGARYGPQLLWLALFTFPLMGVIQEMCSRICLVTGRGLGSNIRMHYSKWVLYICALLLFMSNLIIIGADLGAMSAATKLIIPQLNSTFLILVFALISLGLQIFFDYQNYARYLKWLSLILLSYVITAFVIPNFHWNNMLLHTIVPSITWSKDQIFLICAVLGTTISPYLFFWLSEEEIEERAIGGQTSIVLRQEGVSKKSIRAMRFDVWSGMFLANIVMFFIIALCAATLFPQGITNIKTAAEAAQALRPLAGQSAYILFAVGIIGLGLVAIPVLAASSSYIIAECFGWEEGLNKKLHSARAFYSVIMISVFTGLIINFIGISPIKALIYASVASALASPMILALIVLISANKKIMGDRINHWFTTTLGWILVIITSIACIAVLASPFF